METEKMATLKKQQEQGLVETGLGIALKDQERALKGITQYIDTSLLLIELEQLMDEAELEDRYTPQYFDYDEEQP
jgi:hypothetical protein